jgi:ribosome-associated protein
MQDPDGPERPSRSARKRAAEAAQSLGERLVGLPEPVLATLPLPDALREAIVEARALRSRGALVRQRQYIGKLMRELDVQPILDALGARSRIDAADSERFRRIERWRDRLLAEGANGLDALLEAHPSAERARLESLVAAARAPLATEAARTAATRALFRELRALVGQAANIRR